MALSKLLIGTVLLFFSAAAAVAALVSINLLQPEQVFSSFAPGQTMLSFSDGLPWAERGLAAIIFAGFGVAALAGLHRLLFPKETSPTLHVLQYDEHGLVAIDSRGVSAVGAGAALSIHGVEKAEVAVRSAGASLVSLKVAIHVYPGLNLKQIGWDVREAVRDAVTNVVGIDVKTISVKTDVLQNEDLALRLR